MRRIGALCVVTAVLSGWFVFTTAGLAGAGGDDEGSDPFEGLAAVIGMSIILGPGDLEDPTGPDGVENELNGFYDSLDLTADDDPSNFRLEASGDEPVRNIADEESDVVNPFGRAYDPDDLTIPLGWDVRALNWFNIELGGPDTPSPPDPFVLRIAEASDSVDRVGLPPNDALTPPGDSRFTVVGVELVDLPLEGQLYSDELPGTCSVSVHARIPGRPTTIQVYLRGEGDPAENMNMRWSADLRSDGSFFTTKSVVDPESMLVEFPESHSTLAVISGSQISLIIPTAEMEGAEEIRFSADCQPDDANDIGRYVRDSIGEVEIGPDDLAPDFVLSTAQPEPETTTTTQAPTTTTTAAPPATTVAPTTEAAGDTTQPSDDPEGAAAASGDDGGGSSFLPVLLIASGLGLLGGGVWAYRRTTAGE